MKIEITTKKIITTAIVIIALFYFSGREWIVYSTSGSDFSKDKYLDGGTWYRKFSKNIRVHLTCTIESGAVCVEFTDEAGNVVKRCVYTKSGEYYITFDNKRTERYYEHHYALSEDTLASMRIEWQKSVSHFESFIGMFIYFGGDY